MRYARAAQELRELATACDDLTGRRPDAPFLLEAYVFGELLTGADPLEHVEVAFVLDLPPEEVPWESHPRGTGWLVDRLRLDKGGFAYWWRSCREPAANHRIKGPVRFWSCDAGPDEEVLRNLRQRNLDRLPRRFPDAAAQREQRAAELERTLDHLRRVHESYWEPQWRGEHRGLGRYPEHHLWEAVQGYLDMLDAPDEETT